MKRRLLYCILELIVKISKLYFFLLEHLGDNRVVAEELVDFIVKFVRLRPAGRVAAWLVFYEVVFELAEAREAFGVFILTHLGVGWKQFLEGLLGLVYAALQKFGLVED